MVYQDGLKAFEDFPEQIRLKTTETLSLTALKNVLSQKLDECGVPYSLEFDQVQSGGILRRKYEDCLCIMHPQHTTDYFKYCIRIQQTGNVAFIYTNYYGTSTLTGKKNQEEERKQSGSLTKMVMGSIFKTDQQAYDAEYNYYSIVDDVLREIFGI